MALRDRYLSAQLEGDRRAALEVVVDQGVRRGVTVPELLTGVIQDAQYEIGRLWESGDITIAQEHSATAISQLAISHLYAYAEFAPPNRHHALVACAQGERHDLGARMVADFLECAGFSVHYLGSDVPVDALGDMVRLRRPDLVVLSAASESAFATLREGIHVVRAEGGDALPVFVGGYAFRDENACRQFGEATSASCDVYSFLATAKAACGIRRSGSRRAMREADAN